ncbi:type VII toxin-antitoxin system MntA family adenylyltransferase antitoxin [Desulfosporosinus nitroreducens]|uniref:Nucleotidyltransferase domain-containing protein n=1 Tax=Desulfosporosinus nitroreducens TaxID=2018668 RepID=A0ABT8QKL1_9FIRM|nr:nucleotidyltransferase domain-containing protein [Desulfosporosinus nitroreducens]MCO1601369.1 nucleotidyltransferase domain-containing protein [Desulfosporosinus nitroreducens]MDO0821859.1 nucleotidyltransferase domain-containing protein [Desulfosporosinus nitroreducens]
MDKLMEKCKGAIAAFPEIELVYWFGSRAQGKGTPLSDWDFAVKYNKEMTWKEQLNIRSIIAESLETDAIDLVDWDQANLPLRYAVVQEGVLLISRNECLRVELETQTRSRYWDFEPCLKEHQEAFFRRIVDRGL